MCLDFGTLVAVFLVFIVAPIVFVGVLTLAIFEIVECRRMR